MDEDGKKMSKSLGNVVDPDIVVNGGKVSKQLSTYSCYCLRCTPYVGWLVEPNDALIYSNFVVHVNC